MRALFLTAIHHTVQAPSVEDPAFASRHMPLFTAAVKDDARVGDDRNMDAHAVEPVMVNVDVFTHFAAGS